MRNIQGTMSNYQLAMKYKKYNLIFGFALVCVMLFTACENIVDPPKIKTPKIKPPVEKGYGRISVLFAEEYAAQQAARTAFPSTVFAHYEYTFTKEGETTGEVNIPGDDGFFTLEVGSYTVAVQAFIGTEDSYTPAASGISELFSVSSGDNNPVTVTLYEAAAADEGKFSYTITWPDGAEAKITLQQWPELNTIALNPVDVTQGNGKTQTLELDAGSYLLTILVVHNGLYAGISEAVRIYPVVTTVYDQNFTTDDFHDLLPPASNDYTISGLGWRSYDGTAKTVNVTRTESASPGAVTVYYNGVTDAPVDVGTYTVTFDVAAAASVWSAATGLPAGTLTIMDAIPLTENVWADGNIPTSGDEQWFTFTATASTQYIHVDFGTLTHLYVNLYDSDGATVGSKTLLYIANYGPTTSVSLSVMVGQAYFIRVWPSSSSYSGTYQIAFNTLPFPPGATVTTLTENIWADGNLPTSNDMQWFRFTATASTQYIHTVYGTITFLLGVQVYDSGGAAVGSEITITIRDDSGSWSVTSGQVYYIRVRLLDSLGSGGTYQIAFNTTEMPPVPAEITTLTENVWADGDITTLSNRQWFKFTATASTQYIHFSFGTLNSSVGVYVNVYDSSGATVGTETRLYDSTRYVSRSVTVGQEYYIRVRPCNSSYSGTYRIAFNATIYPPGTTVTTLTANTWADGNLPTSNDMQWFRFTATASTQYIHVSFGTLTNLYVNLYDSGGAAVGSESSISSSTSNKYFSRSVTSGQVYYIRVRPYSSSYSGTYQIGFTASTTVPVLPSTAIQLTYGIWANGNLPTSNDVQWFKLTATTSYTLIINVSFGTLKDLYVQVYDSSGATVGTETRLYGSSTRISRDVTVGQVYYIRVRPYNSSNSGTYQIALS